MTATDWGTAGDGGDVAEAKKKLCFDPSIESIAIQSTLAGQAGAPQARWTPAASLVGT